MSPTHLDALCTELRALGVSQGFSRAQLDADLAVLASLCAPCPWARLAIDDRETRSYFAHGVPYGTSVVLGAGAPEVRALFEAQGATEDPRADFLAGSAMTGRFGARAGAYRSLEPEFEPTLARPPFAQWHGLVLAPASAPWGKGYLSALARGAERATERTRDALARLGFGGAVDAVARVLRPERDAVTIVSLDFTAASERRVKLYALLRGADIERLERVCALAPSHRAGDARRFAECFFDDAHRGERWWLVCFTFRTTSPSVPAAVTLHLGAARMLDDDTRVEAGVRRTLGGAEEIAEYGRALDALGKTGLPAPYRRHHFVSWQRVGDRARVTVYFHPPTARATGP